MSIQSVSKTNPKLWNFLTGCNKEWDELKSEEKTKALLNSSFKTVVAPLSFLSGLTSIASFVYTNFLKNEIEWLDKTAEIINRLTYFVGGIHGAVGAGTDKDLPGGLGYSAVALSSVIGTKENMYFIKGIGTSMDQLPAMMKDMGHNPGILEKYPEYKNREDAAGEFYNYSNFWDSTKKTFVASGVVLKDILKELKEKSFKNVFITSIRAAEKNLLLSSIGVLVGVSIGMFGTLRKIGASIRDIFGAHADIALLLKHFSKDDKGKATGAGNKSYALCGVFYSIGSVLDFIYRWTEMPKLELAAVGFDNLGLCFMNLGRSSDSPNGNGKTVVGEHSGEKPGKQDQARPTTVAL